MPLIMGASIITTTLSLPLLIDLYQLRGNLPHQAVVVLCTWTTQTLQAGWVSSCCMTNTPWFKAYQLVCRVVPNDPSLSLLEFVHWVQKKGIFTWNSWIHWWALPADSSPGSAGRKPCSSSCLCNGTYPPAVFYFHKLSSAFPVYLLLPSCEREKLN